LSPFCSPPAPLNELNLKPLLVPPCLPSCLPLVSLWPPWIYRLVSQACLSSVFLGNGCFGSSCSWLPLQLCIARYWPFQWKTLIRHRGTTLFAIWDFRAVCVIFNSLVDVCCQAACGRPARCIGRSRGSQPRAISPGTLARAGLMRARAKLEHPLKASPENAHGSSGFKSKVKNVLEPCPFGFNSFHCENAARPYIAIHRVDFPVLSRQPK